MHDGASDGIAHALGLCCSVAMPNRGGPPQVIVAFAQQKGGAGKTTLLAHLAHAWALQGASVALVDLDPQRSLATWAEVQSIHDFTLVESAGWRAASDIKDQAKAHDVTLIDCPGSASTMLEAALRAADLVVVPCQPTMLDAWATRAVLDMAGREGTPARVVLNRVPPRGGHVDAVRAHLAEVGAELFEASLGNRVAFGTGLGAGSTAIGLSKRSPASTEVFALREEIDAWDAAR